MARSPVNRIRQALGDSSFSTVVFLLGATMLGWPVVSIAAGRGVTTFFTYLFAVWGLLVFLMFVMACATSNDDSR